MKNTAKIYGILTLACISVVSCKKTNDPVIHTTKDYSQVIIGCKTDGKIHAALDPIRSDQFFFNEDISDNSLCGPSCLNESGTLYYCIGGDKMVDEIDVNTGHVIRSFSTTAFPATMHYSASDNALICVSPADSDHNCKVSRISLSTGNSSDLFTFRSDNGMLIRTGFMRKGNICFLNGMSELMEIDLTSKSLNKIQKLSGMSNFVVYDSLQDKIFYLYSENLKDFSLYAYDFTNDSKLKNYPELSNLFLGSVAYDAVNSILYCYKDQNYRVAINTGSLALSLTKVAYPLINTEIVSCRVDFEDVSN